MIDYLNGYPIVLKDDQWYYEDTKTPTVGSSRPCGHCGKGKTKEGHDSCLGTLPDVVNACCGHGIEDAAYVIFCDGSTIRGEEAKRVQERRHD